MDREREREGRRTSELPKSQGGVIGLGDMRACVCVRWSRGEVMLRDKFRELHFFFFGGRTDVTHPYVCIYIF